MKRTTPTLAVFTPAYNRAHTIERTYKSLCRQTSHDFLWIIVDDGSKDNTKELVSSWISDGKESKDDKERYHTEGQSTDVVWLNIHYIQKENGGMHTAHNVAYEFIDTELAVCIDSDDWMPDNGVEIIVNRWKRYGGEQYAGLIGLDMFEDGYIIGPPFPKDWKECKTYEISKFAHCFCDQKFVYRTDVIKRYLPYPVYPGEKYGQVNWIYQSIDKDYDMLCSNDIYCVVEYQTDGLSLDTLHQHRQSPRTRAYECNELLLSFPGWKAKIKHAIQYDSCAVFLREFSLAFKSHLPLLTFALFPLGVMYNYYLRHSKARNIDIAASKIVHKDNL